jgi:hypothetical protein
VKDQWGGVLALVCTGWPSAVNELKEHLNAMDAFAPENYGSKWPKVRKLKLRRKIVGLCAFTHISRHSGWEKHEQV